MGWQVKFPRFNEIVSITLPDGEQRSGQVLEARGMRLSFEAFIMSEELTSVYRKPSRCAGVRGHHWHRCEESWLPKAAPALQLRY